ncbi:hypothetical protein RRV45_03225 [Bacillus sp. DTU_2020_1000418_1_SI_GHA_SEK_038]|uniref:hypothetical protein n=1 Tax=Bacillus sp. DTU_2020_1000418_1_SI_GHA_SEK_038 TaxID=3077585 RepID=UPI0028E3AEE8|nr:hypothetical protein [Bacillus sp. DTU_2020_1000418_1_SI_GHA_SEK_038]WNS76037.1 hypothetical protein RRV45_03225 [Bacillus sp. DTU_2020_1000418_1_SI_GHA_SEK_038]
MRTWRVGTFSMGASLLLLGIFLLLSQIFGYKLLHVMMSWWPIILIVLGIEILVFLLLTKQEKPFLKYDFLSIFFVGVLGTVGIGFAIISSTGLLEKLNDVLQREERTLELPGFEQKISDSIKRVVINAERSPLTIEGSSESELAIFGTYRALSGKNEELVSKSEDYVSITEKGDTLYISFKGLPSESVGPFDRFASLSATILIPSNVKLEVNGNDNSITLKPRSLMSDWAVDRVSHLSVQIQNSSNVKVTASGVREIQGDLEKWNITKESVQNEYADSVIKQATYQTGKGSHQLQILNSYQVSLNTVE